VLTVGALGLGGCGGSDDGGSSGGGGGDETGAASAPSTGGGGSSANSGFCAEAEAKGATGASFGELQTFATKSTLAKEVDAQLELLRGVQPPSEIASAWRARTTYLKNVKAAVEELPAGGRLSDPNLVSDPAASRTSKTLTDYWFETCG
jgi:hypothetical protein